MLPPTLFTGSSKGVAPALPQLVEQQMTGLAVGDGQEGKPLGRAFRSRIIKVNGSNREIELPDKKATFRHDGPVPGDLRLFLLAISLGAEENALTLWSSCHAGSREAVTRSVASSRTALVFRSHQLH